MREILYRGETNIFYDADFKKVSFDIVYGSLIYSPKENQYYIMEHSDDELNYPIEEEKTISEYTGLKDKNGTKIFENDIIKTIWQGKELIGYIVYKNGHFQVKSKLEYGIFLNDAETNFEVIGDINNNADLLEE